jgi:hypothetical protein
VVDPLQEVQQKIRAVEYCLYNFGNITIPDNADKAFIRLIRIYDCDDEVWLRGLLKDLQGEKTKLLPSNTATVVKGMGMIGRVIRYIMYILFFYVMPFNK